MKGRWLAALTSVPIRCASSICCASCASPPPPPLAPPAPAPELLPPTFGDAPWGSFASKRFELTVPLPDGRAWRIDDHKTPWLSAKHPATSSELVVRSWLEDGRVNRHSCEERARLWGDFPQTANLDAVQEKSIAAPPDFDTFVYVGVVAGKKPIDPVRGFALAFGGHAHRCFVWSFTTNASGAGAAAVVGERLALMVDGSLARVAIENRLAPKIREEPEFSR